MSQSEAPDTYSAALIVIGNEILSGRTQDANTQWIAGRLAGHGIVLREVRVVPDDCAAIVAAVNALRADFDHVFTTGGIGSTHDDITAACVARAFGLPLEQDAEAHRVLEEHYGIAQLTPARAKMSLMPRGARLIPNPVSAAPGFSVENVHVMAGVPRIMQAMLDHLLQTIAGGKPVLSSTVTCALPESVLAHDLQELQDRYPALQLGSYPHYRGGVAGLSLALRGTDRQMLEQAAGELMEIVRRHGGDPQALFLRSS